MLVRFAPLLPPAFGVVAFLVLAVAASQASGSGMAEDLRPWLILFAVPSYCFVFLRMSGAWATWLVGPGCLPGWLLGWVPDRSWIKREESLRETASRLSGSERVRVALGLFVYSAVFVLLMLPFALFVGFAFVPGEYDPWEIAVVLGSVAGQVTFLVYLVRFVRSRCP